MGHYERQLMPHTMLERHKTVDTVVAVLGSVVAVVDAVLPPAVAAIDSAAGVAIAPADVLVLAAEIDLVAVLHLAAAFDPVVAELDQLADSADCAHNFVGGELMAQDKSPSMSTRKVAV